MPGIRNDRGKLPTVTSAFARHASPVPYPGRPSRPARVQFRPRHLRELIDPPLEELLVGPQIIQFISAHRPEGPSAMQSPQSDPPSSRP